MNSGPCFSIQLLLFAASPEEEKREDKTKRKKGKKILLERKRERETGEREITYDALVVTPAHIEDGGWGSKNGQMLIKVSATTHTPVSQPRHHARARSVGIHLSSSLRCVRDPFLIV